MVPPKNRSEWAALINGTLNIKLTSFSLQMKVNALKLDFKIQKITLDEAVSELHTTCEQNEKLYSQDLMNIFK